MLVIKTSRQLCAGFVKALQLSRLFDALFFLLHTFLRTAVFFVGVNKIIVGIATGNVFRIYVFLFILCAKFLTIEANHKANFKFDQELSEFQNIRWVEFIIFRWL